MKVYLVWKDNGECYEDYSDKVIKVFTNKIKATNFIKSEKAKKENNKNLWRNAISFWIEEKDVE